jgi:hypothetical protein
LKKKTLSSVEVPNCKVDFENIGCISKLSKVQSRNKTKSQFLPENIINNLISNESFEDITKMTDLVVLSTKNAFKKSISISTILSSLENIPLKYQSFVFGKFLSDIHWRPEINEFPFITQSSILSTTPLENDNFNYKLSVDLDQMNALIEIESSSGMILTFDI